jgi:hypothetical protein
MFLKVSPIELVINTIRIIRVDWKVTTMWSPSTPLFVSGENAFVTLPDAPQSPNFVLVELMVTCFLVPQNHTFLAFVTPDNSKKIEWSNKELTAGWLATWGVVNDQPFVQVQFMGTE